MHIRRRSFLQAAAAAVPAAALRKLMGQSSVSPAAGVANPADAMHVGAPHVVGAGQDLSGHTHSLGFSSLAFKVAGAETGGNLFIIEHRNLEPNTGPALHLHLAQEEWFYVMEGEVTFQVGGERLHLKSGESVLAPRRIPHTFSAVGSPAHLLIAFTPADKMEQYFIDAAAHPALAATADFMNRYDMQWIGPSPFWKA
jgi:mannose-6-phosphate isomerase-like protein (cupin superfamily)